MTPETRLEAGTHPAEPNAAAPPTPQPTARPERLDPEKFYASEIATYRRELPRLVMEGEEGRYALIKDNEILSIWDTFGDAVQAGIMKFGLDASLFIQKIAERDAERYALLDAWRATQCRG